MLEFKPPENFLELSLPALTEQRHDELLEHMGIKPPTGNPSVDWKPVLPAHLLRLAVKSSTRHLVELRDDVSVGGVDGDLRAGRRSLSSLRKVKASLPLEKPSKPSALHLGHGFQVQGIAGLMKRRHLIPPAEALAGLEFVCVTGEVNEVNQLLLRQLSHCLYPFDAHPIVHA